MKELKWIYDETTAYWADMGTLPLPLIPKKQYEGRGLREDSWRKHITKSSFPEYCHYTNQEGYLFFSPVFFLILEV